VARVGWRTARSSRRSARQPPRARGSTYGCVAGAALSLSGDIHLNVLNNSPGLLGGRSGSVMLAVKMTAAIARLRCRSLRGGSQWQPMGVWNGSVERRCRPGLVHRPFHSMCVS
jgi:hypothetical protein